MSFQISHLFPACGPNVSGLNYLKIIPVDAIVDIPAAMGHIVPDEISLKDDENFLDIWMESGGFKEDFQDSEHGEYYRQTITAYIPKDAPDVGQWIEQLTGIRCVALYQDNNGMMKIIGSKQSPLTFKADLETSENTSGKNGHKLSFSTEATHKAFFYLHYERPQPGSRKVFNAGFTFGFYRT